jgi:hypothetical protein
VLGERPRVEDEDARIGTKNHKNTDDFFFTWMSNSEIIIKNTEGLRAQLLPTHIYTHFQQTTHNKPRTTWHANTPYLFLQRQ